jgi:hypothetical protein
MQLEFARIVHEYENKKVLILAPLAVVEQTTQEAHKMGISLEGIDITNYEQIDNIDCESYIGIVLDESSILKNFTGSYKKRIIERFARTKYKLACTATPAPNDPEEIGNHSEFLSNMTRTEMLAMYFVHDAGDTGEWRLKGHSIDYFYEWISSWAIMLNNPADIGFEMVGYSLPKLNLIENKIETSWKGVDLFNDTSVNATDFNAELRRTKNERLDLARDIVMSKPDEGFIVWIKQNEEADYFKSICPEAVEVRGDDKPEDKKKNLIGFAENKFRILLTKQKIAQFGLNYQNCHNQVFASLDFSFEALYQSIRRSYRFGQKEEVNIYLITTDTMQNVKESIERKQIKFREMQDKMAE